MFELDISVYVCLQTLPRDLPPTIISQGEDFKPVQGQSEWSSDESPEDRINEEPRLKRRPNLKAGVSCHCPQAIYLLDTRVKATSCIYRTEKNYTCKKSILSSESLMKVKKSVSTQPSSDEIFNHACGLFQKER